MAVDVAVDVAPPHVAVPVVEAAPTAVEYATPEKLQSLEAMGLATNRELCVELLNAHHGDVDAVLAVLLSLQE